MSRNVNFIFTEFLMLRKKLIVSVLLVSATATALAQAAENRKPPQIPQEAYDACASASEQDSCAMSGRDGETVEGVCMAPPPDAESDELACRPNNMGGGDRRPPPRDND